MPDDATASTARPRVVAPKIASDYARTVLASSPGSDHSTIRLTNKRCCTFAHRSGEA
jgi:hypothetical protein